MQRVTITIDDDLLAEIDAFTAGARQRQSLGSDSRSCTLSGLSQSNLEVAQNRHCVATLSYIYDHAARELPNA
jgi:CopG family transcriptional regulator, nickel-responsive regulator